VVAGEMDDVIFGEGEVDERDKSGSMGAAGGLVLLSSTSVYVCVSVEMILWSFTLTTYLSRPKHKYTVTISGLPRIFS
jgi:hypothetical protein